MLGSTIPTIENLPVKHQSGSAYADAEYFGIEYRDIELVNGRWYFRRPLGRRSAFTFQSRVKLLNEPQPKPRYRTPLQRASGF